MSSKIKIGQKIIFKENSEEYFQDHFIKKSIPSGVKFTVVGKLYNGEEYWLEAHGYGLIGKGDGSYGNGRICVDIESLLSYSNAT